MNNLPSPRRAVIPQKLRVSLVAALVSLLVSNPVHALPDSFPQYPLQTGFTSTVPPNVMLILDDSGSMGWLTMPEDYTSYNDTRRGGRGTSASPRFRSYHNNTIYYNPANEYRPWRKATMPGDADERMANADVSNVSTHATAITGSTLNLKGNINSFFFVPRKANPGITVSNYDLYRISSNGQIQRCKHSGSDCTTSSPDSDWEAKLPANNKGRNNDQEVQNYANWYHYHRTRMKMAKAGASEAFGQLDKNVRVGYTRINATGVNSRTGNITGSIVYPIPHSKNGGLFEGTNRTDFFEKLQKENANGGTPLRGALANIGNYYKTADPYKNSSGTELSCRKNFAILTTDGDWNGNQPGNFKTLASVADHYWKNDLRSSLVDNVPTSTLDTANWQHMNVFGISIGLSGNYSSGSSPTPTGGPTWSATPKIDDLARAAGEGRGRFFLANNTNEFAEALRDAFKDVAARTVSATNATSSGNRLNNDLKHFGTSFHSGNWSGDVTQSGSDLKFDAQKGDWQLSTSFSGVNANFSSRTVLTSYGGTVKLFNKNTITDTVFGRSDHSAVSVADNIDYLRGVQNLEEGKGGSLRKRGNNPIGDIVNSSPFYALDTDTLYVGANDGMLHALDTKEGGKVLFSYVPKGINAEAMASLSSTQYDHYFLVDGNIDVSTNQITSGKNILIAALGRGGRGIFALDVTDPKAMGTAQVLWDNTTQDATTNRDMGYVLGRLRIRSGNDDKTYALVPNGIESPNGKAVLFAYELDADGKITETHTLVAGNDTDNGLMSLGMADLNGDDKIDIVYGGDLKGNLWRWDFSSATPGPATLLFTAVNDSGQPQPITGGITNARNPITEELFVGFGTGRLISDDDLPIEGGPALQPIQSLYGFIDPVGTVSIDNQALIKRSDLQKRTIAYTGTQKGKPVRAFEQNNPLDVGKKGWYIDLPANERVISDASMAGREAMVVASIFPPDPRDVPGCESAAGNGFLNAVNLFTGTSPVFKPNGGYFPGYTTVTIPGDGGTVEVTIGSIGINEGMPTSPNVVCDNDGCKVVVDKGDGGLALEEGPKLDATAVKPHRLQWRSLR